MTGTTPLESQHRDRRVAAGCVGLVAVLLGLGLCTQPLSASGLFDHREDAERAAQSDVAKAMVLEKQHGYDLAATSNGARLLTGVILKLIDWRQETGAEPGLILLHHDDYFGAFLEATELELANAPVFVKVAHEHGEDLLIDYRRDQVVRAIVRGPTPRVAINLVGGWRGGSKSYSYEDKTNKPHLKVTHQNRHSYRILDFGDFELIDDIRGITGRATSGLLGVMFNIIGEGRAVRSLSGRSEDGLLVTRTTAKKWGIPVTQTVTVYPDGGAEKGLPTNRPDLAVIEELLKQPLEIEYQPLE